MSGILFVCLGNICRSPAGEGIMRHRIQEVPELNSLRIESCGTGDWYIGHLPDERMRNASSQRGVNLSSIAQRFKPRFFEEFDYILAADHAVLNDLYRHAKTPEHRAKVHLITHFSTLYKDEEVPDPYYGGEAGFELVLDMLEDSCQGLIHHLLEQKKL